MAGLLPRRDDLGGLGKNYNQAMGHIRNGGIDLSGSATKILGDDRVGIQLHWDPAMLLRLQDASGFVPVIIHMRPLKDLQAFLGLSP